MEIYVGKHICGEQAESVYDQMYAELFGDRKKTRKKPDTRAREQRLADWDAEKERRKDRRIDAKCNHINKKYGYLCIEQERRISAENVARSDWELEQIDIAECAMWRDINAEIEAERLRNLNEWLKYA